MMDTATEQSRTYLKNQYKGKFTEKDFEEASTDFKFAAAVALYGMKLTDSEFVKNHNTGLILDLAEKGRGEDKEGYRAEFTRLVKIEVN